MSNITVLKPKTALEKLAIKGQEAYKDHLDSRGDSVMYGVKLGRILRDGKDECKEARTSFKDWVANSFSFGHTWANICMRANRVYEVIVQKNSQLFICEKVHSVEMMAGMYKVAVENNMDPFTVAVIPKKLRAAKSKAVTHEEFEQHVHDHVSNIVDEREAANSSLQNEVIQLKEEVANAKRTRAVPEALVWGASQEAFMECVIKLSIPKKKIAEAVALVKDIKPHKMMATLSSWKDWTSQQYTGLFAMNDVFEQLIAGDHSDFRRRVEDLQNLVKHADKYWSRADSASRYGTSKKAQSLIDALGKITGAAREPEPPGTGGEQLESSK